MPFRQGGKMKRVSGFILIGLFVLGWIPCSSGQEDGEKNFRFALVPKSLDIPVFKYARIGAEREAERLGCVEVVWTGPEKADGNLQKDIIQSLIEKKVDGIALSCLDADLLTEPINRAVESGIPVVTWDSDAPNSKRLAFYGVDDVDAGRIMGEKMVELLSGKGEVGIMTSLGADNLERRLAGALSVLKAQPEMRVVKTYDCGDNIDKAREIVLSASKEFPDLHGWLSTGGWLVFNEDVLKPVDSKRVKVVCFDTIPPAPGLLKKGKVHVLIGQKYFGWGAESIKLLHDFVVNKKRPASSFIDSGVDIVTKDNVESYIEKWNQMVEGGG
jgi:ribose transport system substrate-binding protein